MRIVTRKSYDYLNKNQRDRHKLKEYHKEPKVDIDTEHKESDLAKVYKAIKDLSQDQQVVLRLFYLEEYSLKEIGRILDKSEGTVKSRLYHAREEAAFYDELEEQNLIGKIGEVYKGKLGWLAAIMNVVSLLMFITFVYCIVQFFNTENTKELIKWASAGFLSMIAIGMLKLFVWMQMDKNDILREFKRLELQIATLARMKNKE